MSQLFCLPTDSRDGNNNPVTNTGVVGFVGEVENSVHFCLSIAPNRNADSHSVADKTIILLRQHIKGMTNPRLPHQGSPFGYLITLIMQILPNLVPQSFLTGRQRDHNPIS
ncbi:hypothetical protein ES703_88375 [subsurface metagenome]